MRIQVAETTDECNFDVIRGQDLSCLQTLTPVKQYPSLLCISSQAASLIPKVGDKLAGLAYSPFSAALYVTEKGKILLQCQAKETFRAVELASVDDTCADNVEQIRLVLTGEGELERRCGGDPFTLSP